VDGVDATSGTGDDPDHIDAAGPKRGGQSVQDSLLGLVDLEEWVAGGNRLHLDQHPDRAGHDQVCLSPGHPMAPREDPVAPLEVAIGGDGLTEPPEGVPVEG
jgi:hypothetical protein